MQTLWDSALKCEQAALITDQRTGAEVVWSRSVFRLLIFINMKINIILILYVSV